jgi:hypothetical protein
MTGKLKADRLCRQANGLGGGLTGAIFMVWSIANDGPKTHAGKPWQVLGADLARDGELFGKPANGNRHDETR